MAEPGRADGDLPCGAMANLPSTYRETGDELSALELALEIGRPGDVIVMMVHEHVPDPG